MVPFSYKKECRQLHSHFFHGICHQRRQLTIFWRSVRFSISLPSIPPPSHPKVHDIVLRTEPFFSLKKMRSRIADFIDNESSLSLSLFLQRVPSFFHSHFMWCFSTRTLWGLLPMSATIPESFSSNISTTKGILVHVKGNLRLAISL